MTERVDNVFDRKMIGHRVEVGAYQDEKLIMSAFGRLQTIEYDTQAQQSRIYFVGDQDTPTLRIPFGYEALVTWDPEERD